MPRQHKTTTTADWDGGTKTEMYTKTDKPYIFAGCVSLPARKGFTEYFIWNSDGVDAHGERLSEITDDPAFSSRWDIAYELTTETYESTYNFGPIYTPYFAKSVGELERTWVPAVEDAERTFYFYAGLNRNDTVEDPRFYLKHDGVVKLEMSYEDSGTASVVTIVNEGVTHSCEAGGLSFHKFEFNPSDNCTACEVVVKDTVDGYTDVGGSTNVTISDIGAIDYNIDAIRFEDMRYLDGIQLGNFQGKGFAEMFDKDYGVYYTDDVYHGWDMWGIWSITQSLEGQIGVAVTNNNPTLPYVVMTKDWEPYTTQDDMSFKTKTYLEGGWCAFAYMHYSTSAVSGVVTPTAMYQLRLDCTATNSYDATLAMATGSETAPNLLDSSYYNTWVDLEIIPRGKYFEHGLTLMVNGGSEESGETAYFDLNYPTQSTIDGIRVISENVVYTGALSSIVMGMDYISDNSGSWTSTAVTIPGNRVITRFVPEFVDSKFGYGLEPHQYITSIKVYSSYTDALLSTATLPDTYFETQSWVDNDDFDVDLSVCSGKSIYYKIEVGE